MSEAIFNEANLALTENGGAAFRSSLSDCLDLFFKAGAYRNTDEETVAKAVIRAYCEDPSLTMKILFFARDIRGGLGERRFFRIAMKALSAHAPEAVLRNMGLISEYGRFDDLCVFLGTPCEKAAVAVIKEQLDADLEAMAKGEKISLLAKWLPSVNASSHETVRLGRLMASRLHLSEKEYRTTLSALRRYCDILENRLREYDYSFDYEAQPSRAMLKYTRAFIRNDGQRYKNYIANVNRGEAKINADTLFPYDIVRRCLRLSDPCDYRGLILADGSDACKDKDIEAFAAERASLDALWKNLPSYGKDSGNAIAVVDGSGSMYGSSRSVAPIDAALSLGIYFAEHNKGAFANRFITFSEHPRLVRVKGGDIYEKVEYCATFSEVANTNLRAVFELILSAAVKNRLPEDEMPERLYIISDMEFDECIVGGKNVNLFSFMKKRFESYGYKLPQIIFWNVNSITGCLPVTVNDTGCALVSGFSPVLFDMTISGELDPMRLMRETLENERYRLVG